MRKKPLVILLASFLTLLPAFSQAAKATGCTVTYDGNTVNGETMWPEVPGDESAEDCEFHQMGWNNFLYLVTDDGAGHPRFMSWAPWYNAVPAKGAPVWPGSYSPLDGTLLRKAENEQQTGDSFWLVDVEQGVTAYDIRINKPFLKNIAAKHLYTKTAMTAAAKAYTAAPESGGIWLPPTVASDTAVGAMEIKTSWRDYGSTPGACPSKMMHCETDSQGNQWGLVGMLIAQKTADHGEFIWTIFEHVANAPDCSAGNSTPIARNPRDPVTGGTLNVNTGSTSKQTGWSYFNYATYAAHGDGSSCAFPDGAYSYDPRTSTDSCGKPSATPLCNTDPENSAGGFHQVNICRTDPLPPAATSCVGPDQATSSNNVSCLNQSVQSNFPSRLANKWKYYQMIGTEWLYDGASNFGAGLIGCFQFDSINSNPVFGSTCPNGTPENTLVRRGNPNLASVTSETWLQKGICIQGSNANSVKAVALDCFSCHHPQTRTYQGDMSHLFGRVTQSGSHKKLLQMQTSRDRKNP